MEKAFFKFFDDDSQKSIVESVWVEYQNEGYILQNTPFHAYCYSYQDIVEIELDTVSGDKIITDLIKPSGNSSVRILFFDITFMPILKQELDKFGYTSESSQTLCMLAVNIPKDASYSQFLDIIKVYCDEGTIDYEESALTKEHKGEIM